MPPTRSMPPAKPVKTERTHEENQERAYIAASRRSDRSLEARVESARRASEIHKRRTGRSLRVTEQDVVNEEMYEEEDDDLPMQYRRLTAHLQTSNAEFDRRLQSYLAHQMGMRAPLMGNNQFDPAFANMPLSARQFMNPHMMSAPHQGMQVPMHQNAMMSRGMNHRQAPYQMHGARPNAHNSSASVATPQESGQNWYHHHSPSVQASSEAAKPEGRKLSLQAQSMAPPHTPTSLDGQVDALTGSPPAVSRSSSATSLPAAQNILHQGRSPQQQPTPPLPGQLMRHASFAGPYHTSAYASGVDNGPLSMSLPLESQQILAFDPNEFSVGTGHQDAWDNMKPQQPFYSYNPNGKSRQSASFSETIGGMNQTLAPASNLPAALDISISPYDYEAPSAVDSSISPFDHFGYGSGFDSSFGVDPLKMNHNDGSSGQVTPGEADWTSFVDGGAFEEASAT